MHEGDWVILAVIGGVFIFLGIVALLWGRYEEKPMSLWSPALTNRVGRGAYKSFVENGLSAIRERDEFFLKIRYTF